ncbi:MAG: RNA polymerase sigma factor [Actinomycetota bacterium]|nr:RNA polymerase sigma factor [Actinomycetota bacterium]
MEPSNLDAALDAARAGDESGFSALFRAFHPALVLYARRRAPDSAEDIVSQTWLDAAAGFATFAGDAEDFRAWLFTIAHHRIADHYRARARRPRHVDLTEEDLPPATEATEEQALDTLSSNQAVDALTRELPPDQAEIVLLRVVAGLSVEQVARVTGRRPGTVRVIQHRALRRLAKIWGGEGVTP